MLAMVAALMVLGRYFENLSYDTVQPQKLQQQPPPPPVESTRYYQINDGRNKIFDRVERVSVQPDVKQQRNRYEIPPAPEDMRQRYYAAQYEQLIQARNALSENRPLSAANLPCTPGMNVPLPRQTVERSGLPLMPLGDRH